MPDLLPLLIFLFPLAYSPGPGNIYFAGIGATAGARAAVPGLVGYHLATVLVTGLMGLGVLAVLMAAPMALDLIRWAGIAYMLWLALRFVRAGLQEMPGHAGAARTTFWGGAMLLALNGKAYVIIALMMTQFLTTGTPGQVAAITLIFTANNLVAFLAWTCAGAALAKLFSDPRAHRAIHVMFGVMLAGVALWMA